MSTVLSIDEVQVRLRELILHLGPGEEVIITEDRKPVARIVGASPKPGTGLRPPPGLGKGFITVVSDDEEHLADFQEYMP
ncbi:hypothetical protein OJF2_09230 [Aquisphaera giovannonii]|uniref:Antitoxin n=1 Tax=Aquisphaera giovannonii TaxID=406548 RepID=A0A5B9VW48_9BACT|nr:hypothetical protein [Aquisphaera giovannonii]QEH32452.1 hypothetical protein OJF2_09230 [Aquisphaera giovannonii]